jgi:hypothetical protein
MKKIIETLKKLARAGWKKLTTEDKREIYVVVEEGIVQEIVNLPPNWGV